MIRSPVGANFAFANISRSPICAGCVSLWNTTQKVVHTVTIALTEKVDIFIVQYAKYHPQPYQT